MSAADEMSGFFRGYAQRLNRTLEGADWGGVSDLARSLRGCWEQGGQLFMCGNGGSAGNAVHLANDYLYGIDKTAGLGLRVHALSANSSVLTCLANDTGYDNVFAAQLAVYARPGDILLAFSGSGNSPNILRALERARELGVKSYAILGYSGGKARTLADVALHFAVDDMQISEDMQLIVGHMLMQWLCANPPRRELRG